MSANDILFFKHDMTAVIENHRRGVATALDEMDDTRLLNTDIGQLTEYCIGKWAIEFPELGEPQVDQKRVKMEVGRYGEDYGFGRGGGVRVDGQQFTLEVPFSGDQDLFYCRGNTYTTSPPRGWVGGGLLCTSITLREPNPDRINQEFESFLRDVNQYLGWLKPLVVDWNASIPTLVRQQVDARRERAERAGAVASQLKFGLKTRSDAAATFNAPVVRKKIVPVLPPVNKGAAPEPGLSEEAYRDILDTLQQMSQVMERSPHAFAGMDEETLRFQFLVPLNARFEGEARGEVFNYGGKTDILITHKGRNIFIAECKIWKGAAALTEAADQLLGYLSWRDTKAALMVFNRNKSFTNVLAQIDVTMRAHPNFVTAGPTRGETEFRYTFRQKADAERKLALTVLAFDIPAE